MLNISLKPFNPNWSKLFLAESEKLQKLFSDKLVAIIHIGSTSMKDIVANEVIDIAVFVDRICEEYEHSYALRNLSYRQAGYLRQEDWSIYAKLDEKFIIHIGSYQSEKMIYLLLFKLYLSRHDDFKELYQEIKKLILEKSERALYEVNKERFVYKTVFLAQLEILVGKVKEPELEAIYENAYIPDKQKMTKAIFDFCQKNPTSRLVEKRFFDGFKSEDKMQTYLELHEKVKNESIEETQSSPFFVKFVIKNTDGEPVELDSKSRDAMTTIMAQSLVRNYLRFNSNHSSDV